MASTQYASGKHALGICDRCGRTYKLNELKFETYDGRRTGIRACGRCWDPEHPQDDLGRRPIWDPQALLDARPDTGRVESTTFFWGWNPVGFVDPLNLYNGRNSLAAQGRVGTVTVTTT